MVGGRPGPGPKIGAGAQGQGPGPLAQGLGPGDPGPGQGPWAPAPIFKPGLGLPPPFFHHFLGMCFWGVQKMPKTIFSPLFEHVFWEGPKPFFHHFLEILEF